MHKYFLFIMLLGKIPIVAGMDQHDFFNDSSLYFSKLPEVLKNSVAALLVSPEIIEREIICNTNLNVHTTRADFCEITDASKYKHDTACKKKATDTGALYNIIYNKEVFIAKKNASDLITIPGMSSIKHYQVSPDGKFLAALDADGCFVLLDNASGREIMELTTATNDAFYGMVMWNCESTKVGVTLEKKPFHSWNLTDLSLLRKDLLCLMKNAQERGALWRIINVVNNMSRKASWEELKNLADPFDKKLATIKNGNALNVIIRHALKNINKCDQIKK